MATPSADSTTGPTIELGRMVILVRDYDEALAFYRAAFGAHVLFDTPSPAGDRYLHLGFGAPDDSAEVGVWLLRPGAGDDALVGRQTGGQPLAVLYTSDVRAAATRVTTAGGKVVRPIAAMGGAVFIHVTDLYGNEFVLVEVTRA